MKTTDLQNELIENGDSDIDTGVFDDVEFVVGEMIISRSHSTDEIEERVADFVKMLRSEDAFVVFKCARLYAKARLDDLRHGDFSVLDTYDAVIDGLAPWLAQHGYPRPCPHDGFVRSGLE
jgi:hypothetical protein